MSILIVDKLLNEKTSEYDVEKYLNFFYKRIIGFKNKQPYEKLPESNNIYFGITMDKIERLAKKSGRLRAQIWNTALFFFHDNTFQPRDNDEHVVSWFRQNYKHLFIRSYLYFVFINKDNYQKKSMITTNDFRIFQLNSNYDIVELTSKSKLFYPSLKEGEYLDDYMYSPDPLEEISRIESANSDALNIIYSYTEELEIYDDTAEMMDKTIEYFNQGINNVIINGPARSGKTIIAASLLSQYPKSKMLLMNYHLYKAIVDGFYSLKALPFEEIDKIIYDDIVDQKVKSYAFIKRNLMELESLVQKSNKAKNIGEWILYNKSSFIKNSNYLESNLNDLKLEYKEFIIIQQYLKLKDLLVNKEKITLEQLEKLKELTDKSLKDDNDKSLYRLKKNIRKMIRNSIVDSGRKFFYHDLGVKGKGLWLERGNPTISKMWIDDFKLDLLICDEYQRLGIIDELHNFDEYNQYENIIDNTNKTLFVGDEFQKLNIEYDKGYNNIISYIEENNKTSKVIDIKDSIGISPIIEIFYKHLIYEIDNYYSELNLINIEKLLYNITFIYNDINYFIKAFDSDKNLKKHLAVPIDKLWINNVVSGGGVINTKSRKIKHINMIKEKFSYNYPYFCNSQIMPNYYLSAYELISRELDSLYVQIPIIDFIDNNVINWFNNHLYVLFTRPTKKLVVNIDDLLLFEKFKKMFNSFKNVDFKNKVTFIKNSV